MKTNICNFTDSVNVFILFPSCVGVINNMMYFIASSEEDAGYRTSPYFDLMFLKEQMMMLLAEAVQKGGAHIRDPLGGTNATLFV